MNYKLRLTNPFDSFAELMDISERYNFRNSFYFKTCLRSEKGYTYDITEAFVKERLHTILSRGHYVGFHPSENTFYNNIQFTSEVERLQSVLSSHIIKGGVIMAYFMEMKRLHSGIQLIYNMTVVMAFNFIMDSDVGVVILSEYLIFLKESHYLYWKFLLYVWILL